MMYTEFNPGFHEWKRRNVLKYIGLSLSGRPVTPNSGEGLGTNARGSARQIGGAVPAGGVRYISNS